MLLTEPIELINERLEHQFGKNDTGLPNWRVVFSEDQFEKRYGTYQDFTPNGVFIREVTEVREAPKYRQWIREKFVLERLTVIPDYNITELPATKLSYEPMWVFEDKSGNYLPPRFDACKFLIDNLRENLSRPYYPRYKDPDSDPEVAKVNAELRVKELQESLFGDETEVGDALKYKQAIVVPKEFSRKEI
jgi:hypothetical protein